MAKPKKVEKITKAEIQSIAKKLEGFSGSLPAKEKALLSLLLARADLHRLDTIDFVPKLGVSQYVTAALGSLLTGHGVGAAGWVQGGDPWVQSGGGWVQGGDPWVQSGGIVANLGDPEAIDYLNVATEASPLGAFLNPSVEALKGQSRSRKRRVAKKK
jgi:hypothetical protein